MKKLQIDAAERLLLGALDLIENGMLPSDAVTCGTDDEEDATAVAYTLGLNTLRSLDKMSYLELKMLLEPHAIVHSHCHQTHLPLHASCPGQGTGQEC